MIFDAGLLARGWLSVAIASSADKDRPMLNRTVCVETYAHGVRLVATDSYILLSAWVPELDHDDDPEPGMDESPEESRAVADTDGRARSLMGYLHKLASAEDTPRVEVTMHPVPVFEGDGAGRFEGMAPTGWAIDFPGAERLTLAVIDGEFPTWRKILGGFVPEMTDAVALHPDRVSQMAKLGKLHDGAPLLWRFGGRDRAALVGVAGGMPRVEGAAMPVRWDFDRDMPVADVEAETTTDGDGAEF